MTPTAQPFFLTACDITRGVVRDAQMLTASRRDEYNTQRPHKLAGLRDPG